MDLIERLRGSVCYVSTNKEWPNVILQEAADEIERLQAKIDALMLEYCPDEMTPEQVSEWGRHQRAGAK